MCGQLGSTGGASEAGGGVAGEPPKWNSMGMFYPRAVTAQPKGHGGYGGSSPTSRGGNGGEHRRLTGVGKALDRSEWSENG